MYVCVYDCYIALGLDIGSSLGQYRHHLRVTIANSYYQGSPPILSDTNRHTDHNIHVTHKMKNIYTYFNVNNHGFIMTTIEFRDRPQSIRLY